MKKLSIEEKAKRYDNAIKVANKYKNTHIMFPSIKDEIFPELKESEDERIRKEIINIFHSLADGKIPSPINFAEIFTWLEKQDERKPEWSEEDSEMLQDVIYCIHHIVADEENNRQFCFKVLSNSINDIENWIISLKERCFPQPKQGWSEEDLNFLTDTEYLLQVVKMENRSDNEYQRAEKCIDWLKSLRPQNRWKPSDNQIKALKWVLQNIPYNIHKEEISGLLDQIKDL